MLISARHLVKFWNIEVHGVLHVGAHRGEEQEEYESCGFGPVIWIEAQPNLILELKDKVQEPSTVIEALVWNVDGVEKDLNISSNSQSSSIFELGSHRISYPEISYVGALRMRTSRLDTILPKDTVCNFLNLDIQGAEFEALEGLGKRLADFDYVYSEVNRSDVYKRIHHVNEIDKYLDAFGFVRVETFWTNENWGDAFYIRRDMLYGKVWPSFVLAQKVTERKIYHAIRRLILATFSALPLLRLLSPSKSR